MEIINKRIKDLRTDNQKTQQEVADYLKIERKTYLRYEKGEHEIRISTIIELAKYYNVSIDYLLGITDEEKPFIEEKKVSLTKKEHKLIKAYNENPELQMAVDRILQI